MGCFLTITSRDLKQLSATMKTSVSVVGSTGGNQVKIQVSDTQLNTAHKMANLIRRKAKTAQVTTGNNQDAQNARPMKEKTRQQMFSLWQTHPALVDIYANNLRKEYRKEMIRYGKIHAEPLAAEILKQEGYLDGTKTISVTRSTGVDVAGNTKTNTNVVVEVKFSGQEKDFGKMMSKGAYADENNPQGHRQMSDGWIRKVSDVDPERTKILGTHINPLTETVTIYRRIDSQAKHWKPLVTKRLSEFNLEGFN